MEEVEKAKQYSIIMFEPEDFYISAADLILFTCDQKLSATAKDRAQSQNIISQIKSKKLTPDLAIIEAMIESGENEGEQVAKKLRELVPGIKIIAYTVLDEITWADYIAIKSQLDPARTLVKGLVELLKLDIS